MLASCESLRASDSYLCVIHSVSTGMNCRAIKSTDIHLKLNAQFKVPCKKLGCVYSVS